MSNNTELPIRQERPSKSTIFEFDPLLNTESASAPQNSNETSILNDMFQLDLYGTSANFQPNYDTLSISGKFIYIFLILLSIQRTPLIRIMDN